MLDSKHQISKVISGLQIAVDKIFYREIFCDVFGRSLLFIDDMEPSLQIKLKVALSKSKAEQIVESRYKQIKINLENRSEPFLSYALLWAETAHYKSRLM